MLPRFESLKVSLQMHHQPQPLSSVWLGFLGLAAINNMDNKWRHPRILGSWLRFYFNLVRRAWSLMPSKMLPSHACRHICHFQQIFEYLPRHYWFGGKLGANYRLSLLSITPWKRICSTSSPVRGVAQIFEGSFETCCQFSNLLHHRKCFQALPLFKSSSPEKLKSTRTTLESITQFFGSHIPF